MTHAHPAHIANTTESSMIFNLLVAGKLRAMGFDFDKPETGLALKHCLFESSTKLHSFRVSFRARSMPEQ